MRTAQCGRRPPVSCRGTPSANTQAHRTTLPHVFHKGRHRRIIMCGLRLTLDKCESKTYLGAIQHSLLPLSHAVQGRVSDGIAPQEGQIGKLLLQDVQLLGGKSLHIDAGSDALHACVRQRVYACGQTKHRLGSEGSECSIQSECTYAQESSLHIQHSARRPRV
jgi:hypothetical protein